MRKRNVTLSMPADLIRRGKALAASRSSMTRVVIEMIDKASVVKMRKLLGMHHSNSKKVRAAMQLRLASLQALDALRRLQGIGKLEDVFRKDVRIKG